MVLYIPGSKRNTVGINIFRTNHKIIDAIRITNLYIIYPSTINPFGASPVFGQVQKYFLENLLLARFSCWRDISRDLFFSEDFELFFHIGVKKLVNQVINEIFRQMTITLTLPLDVPVRPMDTKGLSEECQT